eukprot:gnl/TRDRNA2_/TRDRNA2_174342_c5_seq1.p1 gnl/TRDRNA2_/TRDRNA2_174342_c5~~gnl/TRDRNA2_/TRDRNA2_174342_c5_seq1.p1  ORF type:complete len:161 (-),score=38.51 gnl/TRDRNA2_/TRDRNA2_174342_c5_seq1:175-657(-)
MAKYKDKPGVLVAQVDCTTGDKELCQHYGVKSYPTLLWGDVSDLELYDGEREFEDLDEFAEENLIPRCGPFSLDRCTEEQEELIESFGAMDAMELDVKIREEENKVAEVVSKTEEEIDKIREVYNRVTKEKDDIVANVTPELKLLRDVAFWRLARKNEEL